MESDRDLKYVFNKLDAIKPGDVIIIKDFANGRIDTFISCAKQRIDTLNDCEFNPDYTKIRKLSDFCNFDLNNQNISKWKTEAEQEKMQVENQNQRS
jgi:hypothetical protein